MRAKVSVIVPVYNVEKYIEECVSSLTNQTYTNLEILLVDDGSNDLCANICDALASKDDRIVVIHKNNGGLVSARKAGLKRATGEFIYNLDGDDWIEENAIEILVNRIQNDCSDIVQGGYVFYGGDSSGKTWLSGDLCYNVDDNSVGNVLEDLLLKHEVFNTLISTKLYKSDLFIRAYERIPDDIKRANDLIAFIEVLESTKKISLLSSIILHYRIRSDSKSNSYGGVRQIVNMDNTINHIYYLIRNHAFFKNFSEKLLDEWVIKFKLDIFNREFGKQGLDILAYKYNNLDLFHNKRIIIFGAGTVGKNYYSQISLYNNIEIVSWMDSNADDKEYEFCKVTDPKEIDGLDYDYILIAVKSELKAAEIRKYLNKNHNISNDIILWEEPKYVFTNY